ncbi:hypothetical protein THMIRHAS_04730 [Thiosulfatimonas sediminis]|uniref:YagK/YfjJ C-terminal domain-containing protein n=1 Tax=Thiosulfatimonas sediminis TaxID=2675054 RepID=A0A6F8PSY7_9GAMM|nr:hypothetical protein THMIRHAS_04730 [Thiosulfatimonas sediminis]
MEIGGRNHGVHIHVLFLLNGQVFHDLGDKRERAMVNPELLSTLIRSAWASALFGVHNASLRYPPDDWHSNIPNTDAMMDVYEQQLVRFITPVRRIFATDPSERHQTVKELIYVTSYLCKAHTKHYQLGMQPFQATVTPDKRMTFPDHSTNPQGQPLYLFGDPSRQFHYDSDFDGVVLRTDWQPYVGNELEQIKAYSERVFERGMPLALIRMRFNPLSRYRDQMPHYKPIEAFLDECEKSLIPNTLPRSEKQSRRFLAVAKWHLNEDEACSIHLVVILNQSMYQDLLKQIDGQLYDFFNECYQFRFSNAKSQAKLDLSLYEELLFTANRPESAQKKWHAQQMLYTLASSVAGCSRSSTLYCRPIELPERKISQEVVSQKNQQKMQQGWGDLL